MAATTMRIIVFKSKKLWYFHVLAKNNKLIAQSEGYKRRCDASKTIALLRRELSTATMELISD